MQSKFSNLWYVSTHSILVILVSILSLGLTSPVVSIVWLNVNSQRSLIALGAYYVVCAGMIVYKMSKNLYFVRSGVYIVLTQGVDTFTAL